MITTRCARMLLCGVLVSTIAPVHAQGTPSTPDPVLAPDEVPNDPVLSPDAVPNAPALSPDAVPGPSVLSPDAIPNAPALSPD